MAERDPILTPDPRDVVEFSFAPRADAGDARATGEDGPAEPAKAFLRLWFTCAGRYGRAYRDRRGSCYLGRCPTCGATVRFGIGPAGTPQRQFQVSCEGRWLERA